MPATFGYKGVKDALVTTLQTVSSLKVVYGKEEKAIKQFPAACVSAKAHNNDYHDLGGNLRRVEHFVRIYFRTDETNDADYEDVLTTVADAVIIALEHDPTLGGICDYTDPTDGTWDNGQKETPVRFLEISIKSEKRVLR